MRELFIQTFLVRGRGIVCLNRAANYTSQRVFLQNFLFALMFVLYIRGAQLKRGLRATVFETILLLATLGIAYELPLNTNNQHQTSKLEHKTTKKYLLTQLIVI